MELKCFLHNTKMLFAFFLMLIPALMVWKATVGEIAGTGGSNGKQSACNAETRVQSLGQEDPLEKEVAIHSSILSL